VSFVLFVVNFPRLPLPFVPFVLFVVDTPLSVERSAFNVERSPHHSPLTTHHSLLPFVLFVVDSVQRSAFSVFPTANLRKAGLLSMDDNEKIQADGRFLPRIPRFAGFRRLAQVMLNYLYRVVRGVFRVVVRGRSTTRRGWCPDSFLSGFSGCGPRAQRTGNEEAGFHAG
jgi:hypothetical protein